MSFRNRLRLFFLMIVVLPMVIVGVVSYILLGGTESGKADAEAAARTQNEGERAVLLFGKDGKETGTIPSRLLPPPGCAGSTPTIPRSRWSCRWWAPRGCSTAPTC